LQNFVHYKPCRNMCRCEIYFTTYRRTLCHWCIYTSIRLWQLLFASNKWTVLLTHCGRVTQVCVFTLQLCRTGDADLRFYVTTVQDGWRRFAFLTRWNSVHLQVLLSATPQGRMFPEVSHPQALLGCLVSISWKFQFTKIVSEFVINF